jgi:hypothetical protein
MALIAGKQYNGVIRKRSLEMAHVIASHAVNYLVQRNIISSSDYLLSTSRLVHSSDSEASSELMERRVFYVWHSVFPITPLHDFLLAFTGTCALIITILYLVYSRPKVLLHIQ